MNPLSRSADEIGEQRGDGGLGFRENGCLNIRSCAYAKTGLVGHKD